MSVCFQNHKNYQQWCINTFSFSSISSPEVSQFLKLVSSNEEFSIFVAPLNLEAKDVIVLAVNNSDDPSKPGGSHWSLLVYTLQARHFYHFDSSSGMNESASRAIAKNIYNFLVKTERDKGEKSSFDFLFTEVPNVVQQSNGYDCGLHAIANAQNATRHMMVYGGPDGLLPLKEKDVKGLYN